MLKLFQQVLKHSNVSFHQLKPPKSRAGWKTTKKGVKKHQIPPEKLNSKPVQEWWDWDGFGKYKFRHHNYPNNPTLRDVQRRRIFKIFAEERLRVNSIFRNEILPKVKSFHSNHLNTTRTCMVTRPGRSIWLIKLMFTCLIFERSCDYVFFI